MPKYKPNTNFPEALELLLDNSRPFPQKMLSQFTDLTKTQEAELRQNWNKVDAVRRLNLFEDLYALMQDDLLMDFAAVGRIGLDEEDASIRMAAIYLMLNCQERDFAERMLEMALNDPDEDVQCAAIRVLSGFVLSYEYEEPIPVDGKDVIATLEKLLDSPSQKVKLNAMEALAFTDDKKLTPMIRAALESGNKDQVTSALCSILHTLNNEWDETVLDLLDSEDDDIKILAIRTSGEMQIRAALPFLYANIAQFDTLDQDMLMASIWAVSEIGDEDAFEIFDALADAAQDDKELCQYIDDALDNLNLSVESKDLFEGMDGFVPDEPFETLDESEETISEEEDEIEIARENTLNILDEKASKFGPVDDIDDYEDEDADAEEEHHHHHHHHHHPEIDPDHYRIIDDLEEYEANADIEQDNDDDDDEDEDEG